MQRVSSSLYCLFQQDGSRTDSQRSSSSKYAVSTVTHNPGQGQEELKTLLANEKKKKEKKPTGVVIMGRRFQGQTRRTLNFATTSDEGKGKETTIPSEPEEEEEEEDYSKEQYPPADDKYKHLEERLSAMEMQKVPGLDFE